MRLMHNSSLAAVAAFASEGATTSAPSDNDTPARRSITIQGETFEIAAPYASGHQLNEAEASVLNQTFLENIRNNVAGKIKAAKDAYADAHNGSEEGFSLDTFMVAGEGDTQVSLRKSLTDYADAYEFGIRVARNSEPADPVEREARVIAREAINAKLKKTNTKRKDVSEEAYEQALQKYSKLPAIVKEAQRRVKARSDIGLDELDLGAAEMAASSEAVPAEA
jgi:hypothetical protein